jgi:hypothetical protein
MMQNPASRIQNLHPGYYNCIQVITTTLASWRAAHETSNFVWKTGESTTLIKKAMYSMPRRDIDIKPLAAGFHMKIAKCY